MPQSRSYYDNAGNRLTTLYEPDHSTLALSMLYTYDDASQNTVISARASAH